MGVFPEGHRGVAGPLGEPAPGATRLLASLAAQGVTLVPVGVHEAGGAMVVRIGEPIRGQLGDSTAGAFGPADRVPAIETQVMPALAAQLPGALRGRWGAA